MDAVTYPNEAVIACMNQNVVPLRLGSDEHPMAKDFGISRTPALLILDAGGKEHHRTIDVHVLGTLCNIHWEDLTARWPKSKKNSAELAIIVNCNTPKSTPLRPA